MTITYNIALDKVSQRGGRSRLEAERQIDDFLSGWDEKVR
jgi:hypothetical protein